MARSNKMASKSMWRKLLSKTRLRESEVTNRSKYDARTPFENDYDRVIFSSSFRRLRNKAQVFSLEGHDFVRTRLTHSVEVATIGRALGEGVGGQLDLTNGDVGTIVATACLLHDIGNPPFGHSGETAIGGWFHENMDGAYRLKIGDPQERADLVSFEGNAQAFRIATRTQWSGRDYGMNLTAATLATLIKYPCASHQAQGADGPKSRSKFGYMKADLPAFEEVRRLTGLQEFQRHPLTYLVEAADDIAYATGDIEDVLKKRIVDYGTICAYLDKAENPASKACVAKFLHGIYEQFSADLDVHERQQLAVQRFCQAAVRFMTKSCIEVFVSHSAQILDGTFDGELVAKMNMSDLCSALKDIMRVGVYPHVEIAHREQAARTVIHGLLNAIMDELVDRPSGPLARRVYKEAVRHPDDLTGLSDNYIRALRATDYVSGMTDGFALQQYQRIAGVAARL